MYRVPTAGSVACVAGTCDAGPAEEDAARDVEAERAERVEPIARHALGPGKETVRRLSA